MSGFLPRRGSMLMSGAIGVLVGCAGWGLASIVDAPNPFPLWWFVVPAFLVGIATWLGLALARPRSSEGPTGGWDWRRTGMMALTSAGAIAIVGCVCGAAIQQALSHARELGDASPVLAALALEAAFVYAAFAAGRLTGRSSFAAGAVSAAFSSFVGMGLAVFCGLICGVAAGLVFATTYVDPCDIPGRHLYCLDPGRWGVFPSAVVAGLVLGAWLSIAVGLALIALSVSARMRREQASAYRLPS